jgi:hypothetical protein
MNSFLACLKNGDWQSRMQKEEQNLKEKVVAAV